MTKLMMKSMNSWTTIWTPWVGFENNDESAFSSDDPGWNPNHPPTKSNTHTAHFNQRKKRPPMAPNAASHSKGERMNERAKRRRDVQNHERRRARASRSW